MRGRKTPQTNFISLINIEERIRQAHPILEIKKIVGEIFRRVDDHFDDIYAENGRRSIPPERLLGAKVLMALYTVRSERLQYGLLFQWFLDINPDEPEALFDASTFSKNQERLLAHATADQFFVSVVEVARERGG